MGSLEDASKLAKGGGCILAHCMGLGKTFTTVSIVVTYLIDEYIKNIPDPYAAKLEQEAADAAKAESSSSEANRSSTVTKIPTGVPVLKNKRLIHTVLVLAPKNTVSNWRKEFTRWTPEDYYHDVQVEILGEQNTTKSRLSLLHDWCKKGGVLIASYEMFRNLAATPKELKNGDTVKRKSKVSVSEKELLKYYLLDPGPDLVVADEAHVIKNRKGAISTVLQSIRTRRRVALTGSPLQNNLGEYFSMVDWVKPGELGQPRYFNRRYAEPIKEGEKQDAPLEAQKLMKKRSYLLHKRLKDLVLRRDITTLASDLPAKREFVICVKMSEAQKFLYRLFLSKIGVTDSLKTLVFTAYQALIRVWNHPGCAVIKHEDSEAQINYSISKSQKKKTVKQKSISIKHVCKSLTGVYHRVRLHGVTLNEQQESQADMLEGVINVSSSKSNTPMKRTVIVNADDDDDDDNEDDGSDDDNDNDCDDYDSLQDFVVADSDYDEDGDYCESDDEGFTDKKRKKSTRSGRNMRRVNKKRRSSDSFEVAATSADDAEEQLYYDLDEPEVGSRRTSSPAGPTSRPMDTTPKKAELDNLAKALARRTEDLSDDDLLGEKDADKLNAIIGTDWWKQSLSELGMSEETPSITIKQMIHMSGKFVTLLNLLALSVKNGDKMIVFSQNLASLDILEMILSSDWGSKLNLPTHSLDEETVQFLSRWSINHNYLRIDGTVNDRQKLIDKFNSTDKFPEMKLIMISTKAGNMGINLQAANRVVIFDSSYNPANDLQAIFRAYRYGQTKNVYVYRLLAAGTMEEKIYHRQVAKLALSARVVDAQMPVGHFSTNEEMELMKFDEHEDNQNEIEAALKLIGSGVKDEVLLEFVQSNSHLLQSIEDHASFLEDKEENHLNEEEKKAAEEEEDKGSYEPSGSVINSASFGGPDDETINFQRMIQEYLDKNENSRNAFNNLGSFRDSTNYSIRPDRIVNPIMQRNLLTAQIINSTPASNVSYSQYSPELQWKIAADIENNKRKLEDTKAKMLYDRQVARERDREREKQRQQDLLRRYEANNSSMVNRDYNARMENIINRSGTSSNSRPQELNQNNNLTARDVNSINTRNYQERLEQIQANRRNNYSNSNYSDGNRYK